MLVDRPDGKRMFRRPRHRWEENIKMDIQELGWAGMDWIDQDQDGDMVVTCVCGSEIFGCIKCGEFLD